MPNQTPLTILLVEGRNGLIAAMLAAEPNFKFLRTDRLTAAVRLLADSRSAGHNCDLILIDLTTSAAAISPEDQGLDAFRLARALFPGIPIVTLGKSASGHIAEAMINEGAQACLQRDELDEKVLAVALRQSVLRNRAETRRYRALFDSAPIGILLAVGRRVVMANPDLLTTLGRSEDELTRLSVLDLFPTDARVLLEKALDADGSREIPEARFDAEISRPDGAIRKCRVFVKGALLNNAPAVALYMAAMDETTGDLERQDAQQWHQTRKMEALARLAGGVAHDFNNLLTSINGYSEHLLTLTPETGPVNHGLNAIRRAGQTAADMTRRLLSFSHAKPAGKKALCLDAALVAMAPLLENLLGQDIELRWALRAPNVWVPIEPNQLEQLVVNLCLNAKEAMPHGGFLTLTTDPTSPSAGRYSHLKPVAGNCVTLTVEDTGLGMTRATLENLFEPFFSTKQGGYGTGLGLATVYGMVNQLGGGLSVTSTLGEGSRIAIAFCVGVEGPEKPPQVVDAQKGWNTEGNRETILLVEDDSSLRDMLRTVLERFGYTVQETASVSEAFAILEEMPEAIDLIITDVMLRGEGGHVLWEKTQGLKPDQRILFISGHSHEYLAEHGIALPANAFLEKPFTPPKLAARVRSLLDSAARIS